MPKKKCLNAPNCKNVSAYNIRRELIPDDYSESDLNVLCARCQHCWWLAYAPQCIVFE